jgi:hypothetical protein
MVDVVVGKGIGVAVGAGSVGAAHALAKNMINRKNILPVNFILFSSELIKYCPFLDSYPL